jgi:hypothetical protein
MGIWASGDLCLHSDPIKHDYSRLRNPCGSPLILIPKRTQHLVQGVHGKTSWSARQVRLDVSRGVVLRSKSPEVSGRQCTAPQQLSSTKLKQDCIA